MDILPELVDDEGKEVDSKEPDHGDDHDGGEDEGSVPLMVIEECHAEVEEDDAVADAGHHLDEVLDGGEGLRGDVPEGVVRLDDAAADEAEDTRPVQQLGQDVGLGVELETKVHEDFTIKEEV